METQPTERGSVQIVELPADQALEFWPEVEPFVVKALAFDLYNTVSIADIKKQISEGYCRVLLAADGQAVLSATITQLFKNTKGERILHVIATAGDRSNLWLGALIDELRLMAEQEKCSAVTMAGRPGWSRKLSKHGFHVDMVSMRLETANNGIRQTTVQPGSAEPAGVTPIR